MKGNELKRMVEHSLNELADAVERGESERLRRYLAMLARFHRYSLGNVLLIGWQRPDATRVAGFCAWKKLGRRVKRGERGIRILAPVVRRRRRRCDDVGEDPEQAEDPEEDEAGEEVATFRSVCVFDVAQTEGRPLPQFARAEGEPGEHTERLKQLIASKGIHMAFSDAVGGAEGYSAGGRIVVRHGLSPAEEFSALVHELAHEMLHQDKDAKEQSRTVRELEAEAVAFVVCQAVGLNARSSSTDYIHLYDGDRNTLMSSLARIRATAVEIIGALRSKDGARDKRGSTEWQSNDAREPAVARAA